MRRLSFILVLMFVVTGVHAATNFWDIDSGSGLQGGDGVWSTSDAKWSGSRAGTALSVWTAGNDAIFAQPSNGASSKVTVSSAFNVRSVLVTGSVYNIIVTNGGSLLQGGASSFIGAKASNNTMIVVGGPGGTSVWEVGTSSTTQNLFVGSVTNSATNNVLWIDGAGVTGGAVVTNVAQLSVGNGANGNQVIITNGGKLATTTALIGNVGKSNSVLVLGGAARSVWDNKSTVIIANGAGADSSSLLIDGKGVPDSAVVNAVGGLTVYSFGSFTITNSGKFVGPVTVGGGSNSTASVMGGSGVSSVLDAGGLTVYVGATAATATNNVILLDGKGVDGSAIMTNVSTVVVGAVGGGNMLIVSNKASVSCQLLNVGNSSADGNTMLLAKGGKMRVLGAVTRMIGSSAGANDNQLVVTDDGSVCDIGGTLVIGYYTAVGNKIIIKDGGTLTNGIVRFGYTSSGDSGGLFLISNGLYFANGATDIGSASSGSHDNTIRVAGASAVWDNGGNNSTIGKVSGCYGNTLMVEDGALATNLASVVVGVGAAGYGNRLMVNGGGRLFGTTVSIGTSGAFSNSIAADNATLSSVGFTLGSGSSSNSVDLQHNATWNLRNGLLVWSSGLTTNNTLTVDASSWITNAGGLSLNDAGRTVYLTNQMVNGMNIAFSGGALNIGTGPYLAPVGLVMSNFTLNPTGGSGGASTIGNGCSNVSASILSGSLWNGGNQALTVGSGSGATNNTLLIDGQGVAGGAVATNMAALTVGSLAGSGLNTLLVTNGGQLYVRAASTIGSSSSNNKVILAGGEAGSKWDMNNTALSLAAGNTVSSNNLLLIDGCGTSGGAVLTNVSTMGVGGATGPFNMGLIVTNGGRLFATTLTLGLGGQGVSNWVVVAGGAASSLMRVGAINVGSGGTITPYNLLTVDGGGVDGRASVTNTGALMLGNAGASSISAFNGVIVTNRGRLSNGSISIMFRDNYIIVNKGLLTSAGTLALSGTNTSLAVSNGGQVFSAGACSVGNLAGSVGNIISVSGADSLWDASNQTLTLGIVSGSNNVLTIDEGGTVDNVGTLTVVGPSNAVNLLGGTLGVKTTTYTNGLFSVGDGVQAATLKSLAGGTLTFTRGLVVSNNATLAGVGTVSGMGTGVLITNGAAFAPGLTGAGTLTIGGSNFTWAAGGIYDCSITNLGLGEGSGWSLLNVSSQAVFNGTAGTKLVIKLNSENASAANFNPALTYNIKILSYGSQAGLNTSYISLDTNSFQPAGNVWSLTSTNNAIYLTHTGTNGNSGANLIWAVPSNGNWSAGANWTGGAAPVAGGSSTNVMLFGDNGTPYASINNLPGSFTNNQLLFSSLYPVTNVISGNALVFVSNGDQAPRLDYLAGLAMFRISNAITLTAGSVFGGEGGGTIVLASNVLGGQPLIKEGPWTLALAASNQFSETIMVTAGVIRLDHNQALGTNSIVVKDGGVLRATAALTLGNGPLLRQASVTGSGSVWTNDALLTVGSNAQVTVDGGALMMNPNGVTINNSGALPYVLAITNRGVMGFSTGMFSIGGSSRSNTVLIADSGSVFMGPGDSGSYFVSMGAAGYDGNTLLIRDGGTFTNARLQFAGASYLAVTNSGRLFTGALTLGGSTLASVVGGPGVTSVFTAAPATLSGAGARLVVDGVGVEGSALATATPLKATGNNNSTIVTNKGRLISVGTDGNHGYGTSTTNNAIVVCQGAYAKFSVPNAVYGLGYQNGANSNYMMVRDAGSVLELAAASRPWRLGLGATGVGTISGNMIYVQDGGMLTNSAIISLASSFTSDDTGKNAFNNGVWVSAAGKAYSSANCEVGFYPGVTGNFVKVTDAGSYWGMGYKNVTIGNSTNLSTNNFLMIDSAGVMENVGSLIVYSNNQAFLNGGTLGLLNAGVSNGLPFVAGDGTQLATLKVQRGTLSMSAGLVITNNANLIGSGIIVAPSAVFGTLSPGLTGVGALTNNGAFTLVTGSESRFDVVTNTGVACDFLAVTNGALTLAGTLTPVLKADFVPAKADRFLIMTNLNGAVSGGFGNGTRATIYAENLTTKVGTFEIEQGAQGVVLTDYQVWKSGGALMIIR